jgi:tetratricopeptide (TPR) repeat protein
MQQRYLFGPVTATFAEQKLRGPRRAGACLAFDPDGGTDLKVADGDGWDAIAAQFPADWQPDFVAVYLPYTTVPRGLWEAPVPLVGLAPEWALLWHYYRTRLKQFDLVVTDAEGADRLRADGLAVPTLTANLAGFPAALLDLEAPPGGRDIDVLLVANLNPAVQTERAVWLDRLARLPEKWRVVVESGVFGDDYHKLLSRARIAFSHNRPGATHRRFFEAAAAGALVFQEEGNAWLEGQLAGGRECVYFQHDNLTELLDKHLGNEAERQQLADAGRTAIRPFSYEALWDGICAEIGSRLPALRQARNEPRTRTAEADLKVRSWQALSSPTPPDGALLADLTRAVEADGDAAGLFHARGLAVPWGPPNDLGRAAAEAAECFQRTVFLRPAHVVAGANLALALALAGQRQRAIDAARTTLGLLGRLPATETDGWDDGHFPIAFDWVRMEWERAAWTHAGDRTTELTAKTALLRWRLHTLLAELTGDLTYSYEAYLARPDLPPASGTLGCALARTGHAAEAVPHLTRALVANPLDRMAAAVLYQATGALGNRQAQEDLARSRLRLSALVPRMIPTEEWFQPQPVAPGEALASAAATALPARADVPVVIGAPSTGRARVSLSMIVRNEEANLPHCLGCVADLVDEIVVVDTGSTDRTKEIAAQFGAKVVDFPWVDSFGDARNEGLKHVTGQWVLWLDGDDRLEEESRQKLRALFGQLGDEMDAYVVKIRSKLDAQRGDAKLLDQVRLFRNHPQIRWQYRIHEQILPSVNRLGGDVRWTEVIIDHVGYQDADLRRRKLLRNIRLLELEDMERPDDPFTLFNLGWSTLDLGRPADALPCLQRSLQLSQPGASIIRKLYVLLTHTHLALDQPQEALKVCHEGSERFPEDAELLFEEASLLRQQGQLGDAENRLMRLMHAQSGRYFASVDAGLRTHRARHLLGLIFADQKKFIEAEAQQRAAVREKPDFAPALLALGDLYLEQARWPVLERVAQDLETAAGVPLDGAILRARAHLARKDFTQARRIVENAVAQAPDFHGGWVLLSHILLSEGQDWGAAEGVLRRVLELNPGNGEAKHNLNVLLAQQGRRPEG